MPDLPVAENIFLGPGCARRGSDRLAATRPPRRRGARAARARARPDDARRRLRPRPAADGRDRARALDGRRVLILDEPTSSLTDDEVEALFAVIRRLREHGVAMIFISHRLDEVFALADRVTVLRDGRGRRAAAPASYDRDRLIRLMVGRDARASYCSTRRADAGRAGPARSSGLALARALRGRQPRGRARARSSASPGLVGAGRTELLEALFGAAPRGTGTVVLDGQPVALRDAARPRSRRASPSSPRTASARASSSTLQRAREHRRWRELAPHRRLRRAAHGARAAIGASTLRSNAAASCAARRGAGRDAVAAATSRRSCSRKWLAPEPRCSILDEPTRGVDVGAKAEIYQLIRRPPRRASASS